jgi:hypothetical protein
MRAAERSLISPAVDSKWVNLTEPEENGGD